MSEIANQTGKEPWLSLETASWWFDKSSVVLAVSLFIGFVCTVIIIVTGIIKEHHWDLARDRANIEIGKLFESGERLKKDAETLRKETAEANVTAKQAELAMQKLRMPRMLDAKKFADQLIGSKPAETVQILYVGGCTDCFELADMIGTLLTVSHWPSSVALLKPLPNPPDWLANSPATWQHRANSTGISVLTLSPIPDLKAKEPGASIVRAIAVCEVGNIMISTDPYLAPGIVKVVVAPKL